MERAATFRASAAAASETLVAAGVAAVSALLVAALAPPGGDAAAHLYRTELLRDGVAVWDNLWFAGHYPFASYSLLYYLPSALLGNVPLVVAAAVVSAALFASLAMQEWGTAARWPARLFGVLAAGPLYTGTYSYALGLAAALGALRLLQTRRTWPAVACTALTLGFSPLAFAFLCVALAAVAIAKRRMEWRTAVVAAAALAFTGAAALLVVLFPSEGRYPYSPVSLAAVLAVAGLGFALAVGEPRARLLAAFFAVWALVNVGAYLVASPFGDNLTRLRAAILPLVLLAAVLARFRPRPLVVAALGAALLFNLGPDVSALPKRLGDVETAEAAFWQPAAGFVRAHDGARFRVEVVPTFGHWEAYHLPRAGVAVARGWYRQLDLAQNPELYDDPLEPAAYRRWLRRMGVRHVLLPDARLGPLGAEREAALLRSGRSGLRPVFESDDWTIYRLPEAAPLLTGPAGAAVERLEHDRIVARVAAPGVYRLRVRWSRYWHVTGDVCVAAAGDGMTRVVARAPGRFTLEPALRSARCGR
jgi:hypothetical protein